MKVTLASTSKHYIYPSGLIRQLCKWFIIQTVDNIPTLHDISFVVSSCVIDNLTLLCGCQVTGGPYILHRLTAVFKYCF